MPVKTRRANQRLSDSELLELWCMTFASGRDYFGDLGEIGLRGDALAGSTVEAAARQAWTRLGAGFLAGGDVSGPEPWALVTFGKPGRFRRS